MNLAEIIANGGVTMIPLLALSVLSIGTILERMWFWSRILLTEQKLLDRIMEAANINWDLVEKIAREHRKHPLGSFLRSPLSLSEPDPEVFLLAVEASADDELARMRKGDKVLELVIALAPLFGLFGTVWGLYNSLKAMEFSDLSTASISGVIAGIGESLISTIVGLMVAIVSLTFYQLFQAFWSNQVRIFRLAGSQLEVIYRQRWLEEESNITTDIHS